MTGQEAYEIYVNESNDPHTGGWPAVKATRIGKGFEGIAKAMKEKPVVPMMIHEAFWKSYFQWADGLEKMLVSEQYADETIFLQLEQEYEDACKRLDNVADNYAGALEKGAMVDWIKAAKEEAIPARK